MIYRYKGYEIEKRDKFCYGYNDYYYVVAGKAFDYLRDARAYVDWLVNIKKEVEKK